MQLWYCAFSASLGFTGTGLLCPDGGRQARSGRGLCADSERAESVGRLREGGASVQGLELGRWMLEGAGLGAGLDPPVRHCGHCAQWEKK